MTDAPFGALAGNRLDRLTIAMTSRLPNNWLGLKLATALRKLVMARLDTGDGLDVERWGLLMRLYPRDNGCEKNLLFTPQMYERAERAALTGEIARLGPTARPFVFVDIGANVGLFSLFVAATAPAARIVAIEPEAGNFERLRFNLAANPGLPIKALRLALGDQGGEVGVMVNRCDRGGTRTVAPDRVTHDARVPCRTLLGLVTDEALPCIDALKIDVEGAEDKVLAPYLRDAPPRLYPGLILIEDSRAEWSVDLFALLAERGYEMASRTRQNVMLKRTGTTRPVSAPGSGAASAGMRIGA
jgi:FkbM family methyltransferase